MQTAVLAELRLLASTDLDSNILLTVVLAGDGRLAERLRAEDFLPLASRVRVRLPIERATPQDLQACLSHALRQAGAPTLMTQEVIAAICDHAQGNPRALMIMAAELLEAAAQRDACQIDETLFFEICAMPVYRPDQGGDPPSMTQLPVQPAWSPRRGSRAAAMAGRGAVVRRSRRHHRRRTQMLQILPRPGSGRCRRRRNSLPAPLCRPAPRPCIALSRRRRTACRPPTPRGHLRRRWRQAIRSRRPGDHRAQPAARSRDRPRASGGDCRHAQTEAADPRSVRPPASHRRERQR